jgi:hypothetical protein
MKHTNHNIYGQYLRNAFLLLVISAVLFSCKKDNAKPDNKYLVESTLLATVNQSYIITMASLYSEINNALASKELHDVKVYKIVYKTKNVEGNEILASGALIVPVTDASMPILSYQHGTLTKYTDAPSEYNTGAETKLVCTILASAGYIISVPDYLGYGKSSDYPHPYEHAKTLASASFDMLMATKEFIAENDIQTSEKLFITGYSEGGFATMALHKYIQENSDLSITMSAPGSGAYNKTAFAKDILGRNENLAFLPEFMWVLYTYNRIYGLNRPWSQYVNESDATILNAITDPFTYGDANISDNPNDLFTTSFIDGVVNETDNGFIAALADNDIFNWKPNAPVTLYYGIVDDYVFPLNSITAYDAMYAKGATVTKVPFNGLNHTTTYMPYILNMFALFESLK